MSEWKQEAAVRRAIRAVKDPKVDGAPRAKPAKKDTRRWCRGKPGVEHMLKCMDFHRDKGMNARPEPDESISAGWKVLSCTVCGKELERWFPMFKGERKSPPAWVVLKPGEGRRGRATPRWSGSASGAESLPTWPGASARRRGGGRRVRFRLIHKGKSHGLLGADCVGGLPLKGDLVVHKGSMWRVTDVVRFHNGQDSTLDAVDIIAVPARLPKRKRKVFTNEQYAVEWGPIVRGRGTNEEAIEDIRLLLEAVEARGVL